MGMKVKKTQDDFKQTWHPPGRSHPPQCSCCFRGLGKKGTCSLSLSCLLQLPSPVWHLLLAAHHTGILLVGAVVRTNLGVGALQQRLLLPRALDIIQEDTKRGPFPKFRLLAGPHHMGEAQLAAHHGSSRWAPAIVTHRAPLSVDVDLHPAPVPSTVTVVHQPHGTIAGFLLPALSLPLPLPRLGDPGARCWGGDRHPAVVHWEHWDLVHSVQGWRVGRCRVWPASPWGLGRGLQPGTWRWCFHNEFCWGITQEIISVTFGRYCLRITIQIQRWFLTDLTPLLEFAYLVLLRSKSVPCKPVFHQLETPAAFS